MSIEHHTVIIVGGGPAGLLLAVVLGGWRPYFRGSELFRERYPELDGYLETIDHTLLGLDFEDLLRSNLQPVDLFRLLHHPGLKFRGPEQIALTFRKEEPIDYLLITREEVGGLRNHLRHRRRYSTEEGMI